MRLLITVVVGITLLLMLGCSGGNPAIPDNGSTFTPSEISSLPVWVSDYDPSGLPSDGMGLMGLYEINVNKSTLSGEAVSLRGTASEDVLEVVDITNFLQMAPCSDCLKIMGVEISPDGNVILRIGIKHPFPVGDPYKPITGKNRADLHVFNVEGIVLSDGVGTKSFAGLAATVGGFKLLNADGYTGYLDSSIDAIYNTNATIHPYITHFADYSQGNYNPGNQMGFESVTTPPPSGNLVMSMGSDYDVREYVFDVATTNVSFMMAVGCTYAVSANNKSMRFTPEYRVPQHNKKAASMVRVVIDSNEMKPGNTSSQAQLTIEVLDINHGVAVGTDLDKMRADSSVSAIQVEVSGVTSGAVSFSNTPVGGLARDPLDPLKFTGTITNALGAPEGTYGGLVKVSDSYPIGLNESPLLNAKDGIKRVDPIANPLTGVFDIPEFATYQYFEIPVLIANEDPVAVLKPNPARGCDGATIWFNGISSYDNDGTIVTYEFDFDIPGGDPSSFVADVSSSDYRAQSPAYAVGNFYAALKVIDDQGGWDIDVVPVTISSIDGLDITPYTKSYVTDTTFSNVTFTPNGFTPTDTQNQQLGVEAMARGSEYIYAAFHATVGGVTGVYIARSGNDGESWGDYNLVRATTSGATFRGVAIEAVDNEVFVAIGESNPKSLYLAHNDNHGEGIFNVTQVSNSQGYCSTTLAVDPFDTNNVYVAVAEQSFWHHYEAYWIYVSNTGPSGPFTETRFQTYLLPAPFNYYSQAYTGELKVAPDRDVYYVLAGNESFEVLRSTDYGANFTYQRQGWAIIVSWGRDLDYCFNPNDPEMIHCVVTYRTGGSTWRHVYFRSTNGGVAWSTVNNNIHGGSTYNAYTNCAVTCDKNANLYVVYTDNSTGNGEVYGKYSTNNGSTFGPTIQISTDSNNDGHVEIVPSLNGCDVVMGWLEDRDDSRRVVSIKG